MMTCQPTVNLVDPVAVSPPQTSSGDAEAQMVVQEVFSQEKYQKDSSIIIKYDELQLGEQIGKGTFGDVFKGVYKSTPVVIKKMRPHLTANEKTTLTNFAKEINFLIRIRHPHVVQFIGASWDSAPNVCFVTEYLENGDLLNVLRYGGNLNWGNPLWRVAIDTARGMAYLHNCSPSIIHRDLKSKNILIGRNFSAKVADFGLSCEKEMGMDLASRSGTALWMAPEVIRGQKYNESADVYSFGVVLSELDTRRTPYSERKESDAVILKLIAQGSIRPMLSKNCLHSVQKLFNACTSHNPHERPTFKQIVYTLSNEVRRDLVDTIERQNELLRQQEQQVI